MANLVGDSGDASSNLVHGAGTNTVTFTMPDTVALNVESVYATVDNSGGGDTSAKLTVRDPSGQVIATKTQGETIDSGATGSATFALRLSDEGAGGIRFNRNNTGGWLEVTTTGSQGPNVDGVAFHLAPTTEFAIYESGGTAFFRAETDVAGNAGFEIFTPGTGSFLLNSGFINIALGGGMMRIQNADPLDITCGMFSVAGTKQWGVSNNHSGIDGTTAGTVTVTIEAGHTFTVQDTAGNPLFRVDSNGDLHGKTGKALVFDL